MKNVAAKSNITHYAWPYTTIDTRFNELEKLFFVVGQELKSLLNRHAEYVDSYRILGKSSYLVNNYSVHNGNILEGGFIDGIYDLLQSFAPNKQFTRVSELEVYWSTLLKEAITPKGLTEFVKFVVGVYIVQNKLDSTLLNTCGTLLDRIRSITNYINVYVYEWSNQDEVQIGQYYFYPGLLDFMEISILIGINESLYDHIDANRLAVYVYNKLQDVKSTKLTPSLTVATINVTEDWKNG